MLKSAKLTSQPFLHQPADIPSERYFQRLPDRPKYKPGNWSGNLELTIGSLFNLSKHISSEKYLRRLADQLKIEPAEVSRNLKNKSEDINVAAFDTLRSWFAQQTNPISALSNMDQALRAAGMRHLISEIK